MIQLLPLLVIVCLIAETLAHGHGTQSTGTLRYYVFTNECFDAFFANQDFLNVECLKKVKNKGFRQ